MSVILNPSSAPAGEPQQPLPGIVPPSPKKRSFLKPFFVVLVILGVAGAAYWQWLRPKPKPTAQVAVVAKTEKVVSGPIARTIRVAGQTSARTYANITAPRLQGPDSRTSMILLKLAPSGSYVKKGDVIVQIDAQNMQDRLDDLRDSVQQSKNDYDKKVAQQSVDWGNLQQTMKVAKANWDKAIKDAQATEVKTDIDRELLKLAVDEAAARYKQQSEDLANEKTSEAAELKIADISRTQNQLHYEQGQRNVEKFTIKTPMDGLAVVQLTFRAGDMSPILIGDQVQPGQPVAKVVDPKSMQVEAVINQAAATEFRIGQSVRVGLDAFPDLKFKGSVYSIGALAVGTGRIRTVPIKIAIEGSDQRLIPDLSAYGDVTIEKADNVLQVPRAAIRSDNGKPYVFVKTGEETTGAVFEKRDVKLGIQNDMYVAVLEGLKEGEEVRVN